MKHSERGQRIQSHVARPDALAQAFLPSLSRNMYKKNPSLIHNNNLLHVLQNLGL